MKCKSYWLSQATIVANGFDDAAVSRLAQATLMHQHSSWLCSR